MTSPVWSARYDFMEAQVTTMRMIAPSETEQWTRTQLRTLFAERPIPPDELLEHLEVFMRPQRINEILTLDWLYQQILGVHGIIVEFGVRWGRHLSVFNALRARHEPTNFYRTIVGFDTFAGFCEPAVQDGDSDRVFAGSMSVTPGYRHYLEQILTLHEAETPMGHIKRFELCQGDAPQQLSAYLQRHPETIVALAYFDMDLHDPTRDCIELLRPHMPVGSVLAFDELGHPDFPGETVALKNVLDISGHRIQRLPQSPYPAFVVL
ncbi:class I SAM-dependent methyltransferase [Actinoplanes flavus]|uniref:Class I SAM-dependent methyltransferase n=1 Tax=Actinoplanes flavus TaxID=2820290 RepID=A0ABS3UFT7_9ACTN|nr:class I SAM-dependent methyltransferase [Actinoplanes flavus]MBO3736638.1 class I SAM-dependent methyltransferase [Actinoplanes flavus]